MMTWNLCAKHGAGNTPHRKHFLEQSVDSCLCACVRVNEMKRKKMRKTILRLVRRVMEMKKGYSKIQILTATDFLKIRINIALLE